MCSDGYTDQNDIARKKYGSKNFQQLLEKINHLPLSEQELTLQLTLKNHQQNAEQRDDITVVGLKFKSSITQQKEVLLS
jgi:serine phosphatase RsbU (regulator of sigma subunit)